MTEYDAKSKESQTTSDMWATQDLAPKCSLFSWSFLIFNQFFSLNIFITLFSNSSVQNMVGEANTHSLTFVLQELNLFPDLIFFIL